MISPLSMRFRNESDFDIYETRMSKFPQQVGVFKLQLEYRTFRMIRLIILTCIKDDFYNILQINQIINLMKEAIRLRRTNHMVSMVIKY